MVRFYAAFFFTSTLKKNQIIIQLFGSNLQKCTFGFASREMNREEYIISIVQFCIVFKDKYCGGSLSSNYPEILF